MATKQTNLRLDEALLAEVDRARGLASRNAWIVQAIRTGLELDPMQKRVMPETLHDKGYSRADAFRRATQ